MGCGSSQVGVSLREGNISTCHMWNGTWVGQVGRREQNVQSLERREQHSLAILSSSVQRRVVGQEASVVPSLCILKCLGRVCVKHLSHSAENGSGGGTGVLKQGSDMTRWDMNKTPLTTLGMGPVKEVDLNAGR